MLIAATGCRTSDADGPEGETELTSTSDSETEVEGELVELTFGPGDIVVGDPMVGLDELASYRATLTVSFNGTRQGQSEQWTRTYALVQSRDPLVRLYTVEGLEAGEDVPSFIAVIDAFTYEISSDGTCFASADTEQAEFLIKHPAELILPLIGAEMAGSETSNGVETVHATFDERAMIVPGIADASGEVWIVPETGPVVKYTLSAQAGPDFLGGDGEGQLTYEYQLTDINQPVVIELPEDCPAGRIDMPYPQDAAEVEYLPGALRFTSELTAADIAAFYQQQLPALGWTLFGQPMLDEMPALLMFTQGDDTLSAIINEQEEGGVEVTLFLSDNPTEGTGDIP
jgi:hypothetical protein